jgi:hypothetical protein
VSEETRIPKLEEPINDEARMMNDQNGRRRPADLRFEFRPWPFEFESIFEISPFEFRRYPPNGSPTSNAHQIMTMAIAATIATAPLS